MRSRLRTCLILMPILTSVVGAPAGAALAADEVHWTFTGQTSLTFDWRGSSSENILRYGPSPGQYTHTATATNPLPPNTPFSSQGPYWEAKLVGLKENTQYHYSIAGGPDNTFRTPPPRGSRGGFTVFAQSDIGSASSHPNVAQVQSLITGAAFVLVPGDLTYGDSDGQTAVDSHFNDVMVWSRDAAYMPAWGNHEVDRPSNACRLRCGQSCRSQRCDDLRNYKGRFDLPNPQTSPGAPAVACCSEDWYWFDYGHVRFIAYPEPFPGAWSDWNAKAKTLMDVAQNDPAIVFIVTFGHRPAYSSGSHPGDPTLGGYLDRLGANHSKYVLNVNGHSHNYERTHPQSGVVHLTVGTGGNNLEQEEGCLWETCDKPSWSAVRFMRHGVTQLQFAATAIAGSFICGPAGGGTNDVACREGEVIDRFSIAAPTPRPTDLSVAPSGR
jgi:hypothetical protein